MSSNLSIGQMLAQLQAKIAHHRNQEAFHAQQEVFHKEQRAVHAAELQAAIEHCAAFEAASAAAGKLLERDRAAARPSAAQDAELDLSKGRPLSRMVSRVIEDKAADEVFGATAVTREIHTRWGARLRRRVDPRSVASSLRRRAAAGRLHVVREGRANHESLYSKARPKA